MNVHSEIVTLLFVLLLHTVYQAMMIDSQQSISVMGVLQEKNKMKVVNAFLSKHS